MLAHIVAESRRRAMSACAFKTGTAGFHALAVSLYHRAGFVSCGPFSDYQASSHDQCLQLDLQV